VLSVTWHGIWHGRSILAFLSVSRSCGGRRSHLPAGGGESIPVFSNRHTLSIIPWFNHPSIHPSINQSINQSIACVPHVTPYIYIFHFSHPQKGLADPGMRAFALTNIVQAQSTPLQENGGGVRWQINLEGIRRCVFACCCLPSSVRCFFVCCTHTN